MSFTPGGLTNTQLRASAVPVTSVDVSPLAITATGAANAAVTLTIPAAPGLFHYIDRIEIYRVATLALAGTAVLAVTTTNLPGSLAWSFGGAMAAGGTSNDYSATFSVPLKSSAANIDTTIIMPAPGLNVLWRANVFYHTGT
jgi:hypothetical protein